MTASRTKFYLDKQNAKFKGVCAGIADYTGIDPIFVRGGFAVMTLVAQQWWMIPLYFVLAWIAPAKPIGLYDTPEDARFWQHVRSNPKRSTAEVRSKFRDIDRRLADIEMFYTSRNTRLSDEIENLR